MGNDSTIGGKSSRDAAHVEQGVVEHRLRERERFLRSLIGNLPGIVYRCRTDERWTPEFMSDGVETLGYTAQDFIETHRVTWDDVIHPEDRERVRAEIRKLAQESLPFSSASYLISYRIIAASAELKHVRDRFRFVYDEEGKIIALEGVMTDVTEITVADERVRESEGRYRLLAENMSDLVCLHDLDGTFLYLSPSCERVLGFHGCRTRRREPLRLVSPGRRAAHSRRRARATTLLGGGTEVMNEYRMRRKGGRICVAGDDVAASA
ncbi:MAG: PAS domain-containing protein [Pyrinomonadaceae bacterium]